MCNGISRPRGLNRKAVTGRWGQSAILLVMVLVTGVLVVCLYGLRRADRAAAPEPCVEGTAEAEPFLKQFVPELEPGKSTLLEVFSVEPETPPEPREPEITDANIAPILDKYGLPPETFGVNRKKE